MFEHFDKDGNKKKGAAIDHGLVEPKATMAAKQRQPSVRRKGKGLPDKLRAGLEALSGLPMDDVDVHYNSDKPAEVEALAYTQGTDLSGAKAGEAFGT